MTCYNYEIFGGYSFDRVMCQAFDISLQSDRICQERCVSLGMGCDNWPDHFTTSNSRLGRNIHPNLKQNI